MKGRPAWTSADEKMSDRLYQMKADLDQMVHRYRLRVTRAAHRDHAHDHHLLRCLRRTTEEVKNLTYYAQRETLERNERDCT
jgi:hypothetical protein